MYVYVFEGLVGTYMLELYMCVYVSFCGDFMIMTSFPNIFGIVTPLSLSLSLLSFLSSLSSFMPFLSPLFFSSSLPSFFLLFFSSFLSPFPCPLFFLLFSLLYSFLSLLFFLLPPLLAPFSSFFVLILIIGCNAFIMYT